MPQSNWQSTPPDKPGIWVRVGNGKPTLAWWLDAELKENGYFAQHEPGEQWLYVGDGPPKPLPKPRRFRCDLSDSGDMRDGVLWPDGSATVWNNGQALNWRPGAIEQAAIITEWLDPEEAA